jgi:hypothetical protein
LVPPEQVHVGDSKAGIEDVLMFLRLFAVQAYFQGPCVWLAVEITERAAKRAGLSIQKQNGKDEKKKKIPSPANVRNLRTIRSLPRPSRVKAACIWESRRLSAHF